MASSPAEASERRPLPSPGASPPPPPPSTSAPLPKLTALHAAACPCRFRSSVRLLESNSLTRPSAHPAASAAPSPRSLPENARSGKRPRTLRGLREEPEWMTTRVEAVTAKSWGLVGQKSMEVTAPIWRRRRGVGRKGSVR